MNEKIIKVLLKESKKAYKMSEIPVGAVVVKNGCILSSAHNDRQKKCDVTGHAEVRAIVKAAKKIGDWRLDGCELYVTLEPCDMCRKIIEESRINKVYYLKLANKNSKNKLTSYQHLSEIEEYNIMFESFFQKLR